MAIKVLIVDDSALMRGLLRQFIGTAADLTVVGEAPDPLIAREMIKALNPDVLTLDVEMPHMDGLEFLRRLMKLRPMPVIMISSLTERGSETTLQALELGAVDFMPKPRMESPAQVALIEQYIEALCEKIRAAAQAHLLPPPYPATPPVGLPKKPTGAALGARTLSENLIAIGASTGGTEAIKEVLMQLPELSPPIVMTQHMPEMFTASFAKRLDRLAQICVVEAQGGERLQAGHAYLAPGHSHLRLRRSGGVSIIELSQEAPVNRHRPSVDVMFRSVAEIYGRQALGVLLTGMGKDGAQGLLEMRQAGAWTIGQDQASCVVYGMPREAALIDALDEVAALPKVAERLMARLRLLEKQS